MPTTTAPANTISAFSSSTPSRLLAAAHDDVFDPLATPAPRHTPRRISDHPLRYPSPNHPLHAIGDVMLGPGKGDFFSPGVFKTPRDLSPIAWPRRTPQSSPSMGLFSQPLRDDKADYGIFADKFSPFAFGNGKSFSPFGASFGLGGGTPRTLFGGTPGGARKPALSSFADRNVSFAAADLSGDSSGVFSDIPDSSWSASSDRRLGTPIKLAGESPFGGLLRGSPTRAAPNMESPVIRRTLPLLADKAALADDGSDDEDDEDSMGGLRYPDDLSASDDDAGSSSGKSRANVSMSDVLERPVKRRKLSL
jgi:hypothetical protein